jgi:hypothetical protein
VHSVELCGRLVSLHCQWFTSMRSWKLRATRRNPESELGTTCDAASFATTS